MSAMDERGRASRVWRRRGTPGNAPERHDPDMDRYLTNKASALRYPPTPDIASAVRNRLTEGAYRDGTLPGGRRRQPRRAWLAMTLTAAMVLGALLIVPDVRAFMANLYIGAVRLVQGDTDRPDRDTAVATPVSPWNPRLSGEIDLGTAAARYAKGTFKLPSYPADLSLPDHVYYQSLSSDLLLYVWLDRQQTDKPALALYQIGASMPMTKELSPGTSYTMTMVGPYKAMWIDGQFALELSYMSDGSTGSKSSRQLLPGKTLVWHDMDNGYTYKLIGNLTMDEAVKIAASMQPLSKVPTPYPTSTPISPASRLDLTGETSLYELGARTGFRVKIPVLADMPDMVQPNKVYVQYSPDVPGWAQTVVMAWFVKGRSDDVQMVLTQGISDVTALVDKQGAVKTTVHGNEATWVQAPQVLYVEGANGTPVPAERTLVSGSHALVWWEDGMYYRLETTLAISEAVRVAESLR